MKSSESCGGRIEERVEQTAAIRRGIDGAEARVLGVENDANGGRGEDGQAVTRVGRAAGKAEFKVRAHAARLDGPVETVDTAFVEAAVLLLITASALDKHF